MSEKDEKELFSKNIDIHMRISTWLFFGAVFLVGILLSIIFYKGDNLPVLIVVILAGFVGGFVSSLTRLHQFKKFFPKEAYDELKKIHRFKIVVFSLIPPLIGGIAAVVLYGIFAGGMLSGTFFPEFGYVPQHLSSDNNVTSDFINTVADWRPKEAIDYIKAIVWGFIAGFSERFVPNILEGFTKKDSDK